MLERPLQNDDPSVQERPSSTSNPVAADPRVPDRRLIAAKLALDGFTEVLHQMEPIGDLPGLWRALTRGLGIEPCTVAADERQRWGDL